jgi:hypothetical protein
MSTPPLRRPRSRPASWLWPPMSPSTGSERRSRSSPATPSATRKPAWRRRVPAHASPQCPTSPRTIPTDYTLLQQVGRELARRLTDATVCRVSAPAGTDLELSLDGREAICDDGDLLTGGAWGNLPAGEAYIAPLESEGRGTIVFDGSLAGWGLLDEPLSIELGEGRAVVQRVARRPNGCSRRLKRAGAIASLSLEVGEGSKSCFQVLPSWLISQRSAMLLPSSLKMAVTRCKKSRGEKSGSSRHSFQTPSSKLILQTRGAPRESK